jgi:hypothetical protein
MAIYRVISGGFRAFTVPCEDVSDSPKIEVAFEAGRV